MFRDRIDAGEQLALALQKYHNKKNTLVIGLPRGGIPVAYEVAQNLKLPLDVVCPRKIGAPFNKEFAIGAITETGEGIFDNEVISRLQIPKKYIEEEVEIEKETAQHRLGSYRKGRSPRNIKEKTVILIDDGLATGATMKAAIRTMRAERAESIVVAIPVSSLEALEEIRKQVDDIICLFAPRNFQAVGQFYQDFTPTEDEEVIELLKILKT
ncbi:MAG TPA: phosphoribosyltransferase [Waddliaceae bacterium]